MRRLAPRLSARSKQSPMLNRCKRMAETLLPASWIAASTRTLEISVGFPADGALLRSDGAVTARNSMSHTREKQCRKAGKMGEVGPPRKRGWPLRFPLFAPAALNGHLALRGSRLPPTEGRITERFSGWLGLYQLLGGA